MATKVYTYTRVSTAMQVDGYSLDAQKSRMKAFADYNGYEIVGEYEDAGKSGKSIEGRLQFSQMMDDIKSGKDGVSYVLVFKLSRFGRNAACFSINSAKRFAKPSHTSVIGFSFLFCLYRKFFV